MSKAGLAVLGGVIIGIAFAIFPWTGVAETWAAENASSTVEMYQLVALVAVGLAAFAMLISGMWKAVPGGALGFLVLVVGAGAASWIGIGMVLGG